MKYLLILIFFTPKIYTKTFVYCSEASPTAFNPQITTDGTSNNASTHTVYNRLIEHKYGTTKLIPALAKSWSISKDKKTYTFKLRKNISFHKTKYFTPSRSFNADDVLFSVNRQLDKKHPYHMVNGGLYDYFNSMNMKKIIKSIIKVDDYTVKFILHKPNAPFLSTMAMSFFSILSNEYAKHLDKINKKENIDYYPIGTGPFVYKKYVKDSFIRYKAFDKYFGKRPKIDNLVFSINPDASVRYQKLKTGECHIIIEPSPADIPAIEKNKNLKLLKKPGFNISYLAINTKIKPFDNIKVRKAINHALNKKSYIKAIYLNNADIAKNPLPPTLWGYNKKIIDYKYDVAKAKKLLKEAGYPKGFSTTIWTLPVTRPYNPNGKKMGEMMQADLAKVSINAKLLTYDWPTYLKKSRKGQHKLIQLGWTGDNADPDNFLYTLLSCPSVKSGSNVALWCNKEFDKIVTNAKLISNTKKRIKLYKKAQKIFKEDAPWVTIAHSIVFRAMSKKVKGYKIDPLGGDIFHYVDLN